MIKIIYGSKGTGKTKKIIEMVNTDVKTSNGCSVFLADTNRYRSEINYAIKFLNTKELKILGEDNLISFLKGLLSGNFDINEVFIDGAARMINEEIQGMRLFMEKLEDIAIKNNIKFVLTISCDKENLPEFFEKYID